MHLINILELVLFVPLALPKTDRKTLQEAETSVLTEEMNTNPEVSLVINYVGK
jgi:hypothetical protein